MSVSLSSKEKHKRTSVRLSEDCYDTLIKICNECNMSQSVIINHLIKDYADNLKQRVIDLDKLRNNL